jgi:hypothetical protein
MWGEKAEGLTTLAVLANRNMPALVEGSRQRVTACVRTLAEKAAEVFR